LVSSKVDENEKTEISLPKYLVIDKIIIDVMLLLKPFMNNMHVIRVINIRPTF
jgi:hypothetical protein